MKTLLIIGLLIMSLAGHAEPAQNSTVCATQIFVTTPQTVSFYLGDVGQDHFAGTTAMGKWLRNNTICLNNQFIHAVVWDSEGKKHKYKSIQRYNNVNNTITVLYPKDFAKAPVSQENISCQIHLINNSKEQLTFYVKSATPAHELATAAPYQNKVVTSPCFTDEKIIARQMQQNAEGKLVAGDRYQALQTYSDINQLALIIYPEGFNRDPLEHNWSLVPATPQ